MHASARASSQEIFTSVKGTGALFIAYWLAADLPR
jgi:hypothetical protein